MDYMEDVNENIKFQNNDYLFIMKFMLYYFKTDICIACKTPSA